MDIGRTDGVQGPGRIEGRKVERSQAASTPPAARVPDRAELSEVGRLVAEAMSLPEVRLERIAEFKKLIESGSYQTDERLAGAFDKFRAELRGS